MCLSSTGKEFQSVGTLRAKVQASFVTWPGSNKHGENTYQFSKSEYLRP